MFELQLTRVHEGDSLVVVSGDLGKGPNNRCMGDAWFDWHQPHRRPCVKCEIMHYSTAGKKAAAAQVRAYVPSVCDTMQC